jgi:hypothetical protein
MVSLYAASHNMTAVFLTNDFVIEFSSRKLLTVTIVQLSDLQVDILVMSQVAQVG